MKNKVIGVSMILVVLFVIVWGIVTGNTLTGIAVILLIRFILPLLSIKD